MPRARKIKFVDMRGVEHEATTHEVLFADSDRIDIRYTKGDKVIVEFDVPKKVKASKIYYWYLGCLVALLSVSAIDLTPKILSVVVQSELQMTSPQPDGRMEKQAYENFRYVGIQFNYNGEVLFATNKTDLHTGEVKLVPVDPRRAP